MNQVLIKSKYILGLECHRHFCNGIFYVNLRDMKIELYEDRDCL
ncbi:MAG: hypothetical protein Q8N77_01370 [Nanoarchaeota archaeon]|nr:hypothetical protein [Nanoarchaeota archaeon]